MENFQIDFNTNGSLFREALNKNLEEIDKVDVGSNWALEHVKTFFKNNEQYLGSYEYKTDILKLARKCQELQGDQTLTDEIDQFVVDKLGMSEFIPQAEPVSQKHSGQATQAVSDMNLKCDSLTKVMMTDPLNTNTIKAEMNHLLKDEGLIKANVIIMNALQSIMQSVPSTRFHEINKAVLEEKLKWLENLWADIDFIKGTKEFETIPNAMLNVYWNNEFRVKKQPDKKVEIKKSTISLGDLSMCNSNVAHKHPIQELSGTCGTISVAQALAREDLSQADFVKLMTCINHYSDLADKDYMPKTINQIAYLSSREGMPGNKNLDEIMAGIKLLITEGMIPLHGWIRNDIALGEVKKYDHTTKKGEAKIQLIFNHEGTDKYECNQIEKIFPVSNLQLYPQAEFGSVSTIGRDFESWSNWSDNAKNETPFIWLIAPAVEGHYVAVLLDTSECTVTVRESADEISNGLKNLEFTPIQFSCYGAAENNKIIFNCFLKDTVGVCKNINQFFKGYEIISEMLGNVKGTSIEHVSSTNVIISEYPKVSIDYNALHSFVQFANKFDYLLKKLGITRHDPRKLNILIELHKKGSKDDNVVQFFNEIQDIMALDEEQLKKYDFSELKKLYDKITLESLESLYKKV